MNNTSQTPFFHVEQLELSNGIPVLLQHYEGSVATTYWWNKVGSADEVGKEAGFAHFLEHMLFKDAAAKETGQASTGKMARTIESLGGDINAYTSFDQTVYHVTCAAHHWERVLDAFGTIGKPQRFLGEDFRKEREVVLEELRKNEDSPGRQLFQTLFSKTFSKHPYGRPVIGNVKTLKAATAAELEKFYRKHYVSGNMGLVLVGPLTDAQGKDRRKSILRYLEKHFGSKVIKRRAGTLTKRSEEPELRKGPEWQVKPFDVKTPSLSFSFRVPALDHPDTPALDLLAGVLGMGELSRLYRRLFYGSSLVTDISGGMYVPQEPGMIYFQAELESVSKINQATQEIFEEFRKMIEEGPTPEELARVLAHAESERLYSTQTVDGMSGRLGFLKFVVGDLEFDKKYLDRLREVNIEKMKEVARKYLNCRRMSGVVMVPKAEAQFDLATIESASTKMLSFQTEEVQVPQAEKSRKGRSHVSGSLVEFFQLPSGLQVSYLYRPQSHVFSVQASALGGLRLEIAQPLDRPETDWGTSYMLSLVWNKGTSKLNSREISAVVEGRAASLDGFAGRNTVGLQMTGLARDWNALSPLFTQVLVDPVFPKDEVDHARRIAEDSVRGVEDHSSQLCSKLFLETLFESHPYGRMTHGSLESLQAIHSQKLMAFHRSWVRPDRVVISVSGPIDRASLDRWLQDLDQQLCAMATSNPILIPTSTGTLRPEPQLKAPRWVERSLGREQCHILVGGLGTELNAADRHVLRLLQTLLGGQSGRLFIELREKKSLAYTVAPVSFEGLEPGYLGVYIASAPQKKDEAVAGIRMVLEKLAEKGPSATEVSRAREFFLGRRAMDLQSDSSLAAHYGLETLYKVPYLTEDQFIKKINAINPHQIQAACKKYLVDPFMVTSKVG